MKKVAIVLLVLQVLGEQSRKLYKARITAVFLSFIFLYYPHISAYFFYKFSK